jgi:hypothetical protein
MSKRKAETKRQKMVRIWTEARGIYQKRSVRPDKSKKGIVVYETTIDRRYRG